MLKNGLTYFKNLATAGVSLWILQKFSEKCVIEYLRVIVQVFSCGFYKCGWLLLGGSSITKQEQLRLHE